MTFEEWTKEVDKIFNSMIGLDHDSAEDWDWYNAFDDGSTPQEAVMYWAEDNFPSLAEIM